MHFRQLKDTKTFAEVELEISCILLIGMNKCKVKVWLNASIRNYWVKGEFLIHILVCMLSIGSINYKNCTEYCANCENLAVVCVVCVLWCEVWMMSEKGS